MRQTLIKKKECIKGLLKNKTRVLVTHAVDFLHLADRIVVLKEGKIQAEGTYLEMQENPHLQEVLSINKRNMDHNRKQQALAMLGEEVKQEETLLIPESKPSQLLLTESKDIEAIEAEPNLLSSEYGLRESAVSGGAISNQINRSTMQNTTKSSIKIVGNSNSQVFTSPIVGKEDKIVPEDYNSDSSDEKNDDDLDQYETATQQLEKFGLEKAGASGKLMQDEQNEEVIVTA